MSKGRFINPHNEMKPIFLIIDNQTDITLKYLETP